MISESRSSSQRVGPLARVLSPLLAFECIP